MPEQEADRKSGGVSITKLAFVGASLYSILYSPVLQLTGTGIVRPLVLIGVLGGLLTFALQRSQSARVPFAAFVGTAGLVVALAIGQCLAFFGGGDTYVLGLLVGLITGLLPLTYLVVAAVPPGRPVVVVLARVTALLGGLQSILILADWASPGIRAAFTKVVMQPEALEGSFRASGLTSMTGDGLSISQAICAMCALHLAANSKRWPLTLGWGCVMALVLTSMIFVGRSGFVLFGAFSLVLILGGHKPSRAITILAGGLGLLLSGIWLMSFVIVDDRLRNLFERALSSAFEAAIGAGSGTGFHTASTDALWSMIILPESLRSWLIGYGYYSSTIVPDSNYMGTDIGYIRLLLYFGVLGSAVLYAWYLAVAAWVIQTLPKYEERQLCGGLIACFFISQAKFNFLLLAAPLGYTLLMLFAAARGRP